MKPRQRAQRALLRNRRRGIQPYALLAADPCTAMVGIRKLHPAERAIMRRAMQREVADRLVLPDEKEMMRRIFPEMERS